MDISEHDLEQAQTFLNDLLEKTRKQAITNLLEKLR